MYQITSTSRRVSQKKCQNSLPMTPKLENKATSGFLRHILILRFVTRLRQLSNNINIHSIKQEHLTYVNDPTLIKSSYAYQGGSLRKFIELKTVSASSNIRTIRKFCSRQVKSFLEFIAQFGTRHQSITIVYEIIIAFLVTFQFFAIAVSLAFDLEFPFYVELITYIILCADILFKFQMGYYNKQNILYLRKNKLFVLDYTLLLDIGSLVPQLFYSIFQNQASSYARLLFYLRVNNLNQVFSKIEYKLSDFKQNFLQLFKLYLTLITAAHIIGCFWYILGTEIKEQNWIENYFKLDQHDDPDYLTLYITSLYWAITTMLTVGYGDVLPINQDEKIYTIFTMLIGCCLFGYVMNSIGVIFDRINNNEKELRQEMQKLNNFLDSKNIDEKLKSKFRKYLEHTHLKQQSHKLMGRRNVQNISNELMQEFNNEILLQLSRDNFILSTFSGTTILQLSRQLQEQNFLPDELIFEKNSNSFHLYLILQGEVIESFNRQPQSILEVYKNNQCFGEIDFISNQRLQCAFISQTFTNTFTLEREASFQIIREHSSDDYEKIAYIRDLTVYSKSMAGFKRTCPICYKNDHLMYSCLQIHYYPNLVRILFSKILQKRQIFQRNRHQKTMSALSGFYKVQDEALVFLEDNHTFLQIKSNDDISEQDSEQSVDLDKVFDDNMPIEEDTFADKRATSFKKTVFERMDIREKVGMTMNQDILNQYRQQREQRSKQQKWIATNNNIIVKENFYSLMDFDKFKQYRNYFPQYNIL